MRIKKYIWILVLCSFFACTGMDPKAKSTHPAFRTIAYDLEGIRGISRINIEKIILDSEARVLDGRTKNLEAKLESTVLALIDLKDQPGQAAKLYTKINKFSEGSLNNSGSTKVSFSISLEGQSGKRIWSGDFNYIDRDLSENWLNNSASRGLKNQLGWLSANDVLARGLEMAIEELSGLRQKSFLNQDLN